MGWRNRRLLLHPIEDLLLHRFEPEAPRQGGVGGWVWGEKFDLRHPIPMGGEIKAVTPCGTLHEAGIARRVAHLRPLGVSVAPGTGPQGCRKRCPGSLTVRTGTADLRTTVSAVLPIRT